MAFTIEYTDEIGVKLKTKGDGKWKHVVRSAKAAVDVFSGYDGENTVTVQVSAMQSGTVDILVTHSQCDNYITKRHESIRCRGFDPDKIAMTINQMIKELLKV